MTDTTAENIQRAIRRLVLATIGLFVALGAAGAAGYWISSSQRGDLRADERRTATREAQTRAALCSFKDDLDHRVQSTQDYLAAHPGVAILGVPRVTIVTNLNNQQRTLRSLASLRCPTG